MRFSNRGKWSDSDTHFKVILITSCWLGWKFVKFFYFGFAIRNLNLSFVNSMRALRCERQMLSHQMKKKLSKQDRHNLYLKWGIGLNSKHRRLQLVHRLWTDTRDIDHIAQSACVVAKLVGSVEPEQAFKEMFGLNFTPRPPSRSKYHRWKPIVKALL